MVYIVGKVAKHRKIIVTLAVMVFVTLVMVTMVIVMVLKVVVMVTMAVMVMVVMLVVVVMVVMVVVVVMVQRLRAETELFEQTSHMPISPQANKQVGRFKQANT